MTIKIEKKRVESFHNGDERDFRAYVIALRDLKVGESFLWKMMSNDRMAMSIISMCYDRKFVTRKEGDLHRIGRTI